MLKIISTSDLKLGMFVQKLEGSWIEHPFWRKSFLLEDLSDLNKIKK
ncbi:DUF3391 domain-containing protein [Methylobacillus caricis]|nr:DUF3391 domain-containing protein [Methylobacillus caricis]